MEGFFIEQFVIFQRAQKQRTGFCERASGLATGMWPAAYESHAVQRLNTAK